MKDIIRHYGHIHPTKTEDIGVCFYCGCEADKEDYVPPLKQYQFYVETSPDFQAMIIPSCMECAEILKECVEKELDQHVEFVKDRLKFRYRKALNIYNAWSDEEELKEISLELQKSIKSGLALGKETSSRLNYPGFPFTYDNSDEVINRRFFKVKTYEVYGEIFTDFREALLYASSNYRININVLRDRILNNPDEINFNKTIKEYHEEIEEAIFQRRKRKLCKEFSIKHKQPVAFIERTVEHYMKKFDTRSVEFCLDYIYENRIKKY